ncbi:hypothetical protein QIH93_15165 [Bradyrhizobium ottawaense]|uniref:GIY-YIG nuclease family protein n=1 Tax=Bradyrhizobium ottawaense TaxID=931866 RepID=UPI0027149B1E|nr:GIY-YIG nuclease family protein [Bradyrhizobium ottawaense]WLB49253.1 hypothetical protein QIH93_15165 [Bradyrhizobium ottawaense]
MIEPIERIQKVPNRNPDRTFIYFVRSGEFIKIGQSRRWKQRVETMQVGSPHTLIVMLVLKDEPKLEGKLHNWFRADHFRGEWFHSGPALLAYIKKRLPECVSKSDECELKKPTDWDDL